MEIFVDLVSVFKCITSDYWGKISKKGKWIFSSLQYGTLEAAGTVDFYPGTGKGAYGCYQPGCYDVFDVVACSHSRAHQYYIASIKDAACLASRVCHGDPKTYPDNCQNIRNNTRPRSEVTMGYWWSQANISAGSYTVEIKSTSPYCKN